MKEITDKKIQKNVLFLINNIFETNNNFPLYNSIFIEYKHFQQIKNYTYKILLKNTEEYKRCILFLFKDHELNKRAFLIFKDGSMKEIDINCPEQYYNYTVFDASVKDNNIILSDTYIICGYKINNESFTNRISKAEYFINDCVSDNLLIATSHVYDHIPYEEMDNSNLELFYIPENLPFIPYLNRNSFKWKPIENILGNIKVVDCDGEMRLFITNFKKDILFAETCDNLTIENIKNLEDYKSGCIVQFNINSFTPVKVNTETTYPTNLRYIEKCIHVKNENIKLRDLII